MLFRNYSFRLRCFFSHLCVSLFLGCMTASFVYVIWYPGVLAKAIGVSHIFLLLLCIDIIVGPILTLFLAREGKKGVWFDLTVVVIIQLTALVYGVWHIAEGRPAWQVINIHRVELISALDMKYANANPPFSRNPIMGPGWALVRPAKDKVEQSDWLWKELEGGGSPAQHAELLISIDGNWQYFEKEIKALDDLLQYNSKDMVEKIKLKYPNSDGFMPMIGVDVDMTVLVSRKEKKILAVVDLRPW
ncbi:MAG: TfpX/TfpZ family type IV pilin accessory protein [Cardiobacteriaceae bacterium]|nr:TfpX/TfpZ family type IV pilin accessory protein [Cardiobacteriaceae bacterium]